MALDLLRLAHHARSYGGPMTKGQWLLVGAIALSLAVGPVSERSGLSQHRNDGSALVTMKVT